MHERSIADHYDAFVADTPLCRVDSEILCEQMPGPSAPRNEVILDLGCGSGRSAIPLAQRGYDVVGVDLSLPMLEVLQLKPQPEHGRVSAVHANLVELDCFADNSADHAICMFSTLGMIQGRANRAEMLSHVSRIVRPQGRFVLHVHNRWASLGERHGVATLIRSWWRSRRSTEAEFGDATYAYRGLEKMFMHRYSRRELVQDMKGSQWKIESVRPLTIDGSRIAARGRIAGGFILIAIAK